MRPTKVTLELPAEVSFEFAAWPGFLPGLLPELTWVTAADADLVISVLGPDGQAAAMTGPALIVVPSYRAYRSWTQTRRRALGFACMSTYTADLIGQQESAPCISMPWDAALPIEAFTSDRSEVASDSPSEVWCFLPSGDRASAEVLRHWLQGLDPGSDIQVVVVGPLEAEASLMLTRARSRDRLTVFAGEDVGKVLGRLQEATHAVVIDHDPTAELFPYFGACTYLGLPVLAVVDGAYSSLPAGVLVDRLPASTQAQAVAAAITGLVGHSRHRSSVDPVRDSHVKFSAALGTAISLALSYAPLEEAVHAMACSLAERALNAETTRSSAAQAFTWMLQQQPWADYTRRA